MGADARMVMLRPDVTLCPDSSSDRVIVVDEHDGRQFRLSQNSAQILAMFDGHRTYSDIAIELGGGAEFERKVISARDRFMNLGLVIFDDGFKPELGNERISPRKRLIVTQFSRWKAFQRLGRRIRLNPPSSLEFSFRNSERAMKSLSRLSHKLESRSAEVARLLVGVFGLGVFSFTWSRRYDELARPASGWTILAVLLLTLATTSVHELAHGLVLMKLGGRVRRFGFMFLYGSPALFCDVSDAWRLQPFSRVRVALAGPKTHLFFAGIAGGIAAFMPNTSSFAIRQTLSLVAVMDLCMAVVNLIPFVKFDGYIALVGWTDIPFLRLKSMELARDFFGHFALGAGRRKDSKIGTELTGMRWVLFGMACMVTAPILVMEALVNYGPIFVAVAGRVGAVVILFLIGLFGLHLLRFFTNMVLAAQSRGVRLWRSSLGLIIGSSLLAMGLVAIKVPSAVLAPYERLNGTLFAVLPTGIATNQGEEVKLMRPGILFHPKEEVASVCGLPETLRISLMAGSPLVGGLAGTPTAPKRVVRLCTANVPGEHGIARFEMGQVSLDRWLMFTFVTPYINQVYR